jgi:hypothetical protein
MNLVYNIDINFAYIIFLFDFIVYFFFTKFNSSLHKLRKWDMCLSLRWRPKRTQYFAFIFKMQLKGGLVWQWHKLSLDEDVKLIYT